MLYFLNTQILKNTKIKEGALNQLFLKAKEFKLTCQRELKVYKKQSQKLNGHNNNKKKNVVKCPGIYQVFLESVQLSNSIFQLAFCQHT